MSLPKIHHPTFKINVPSTKKQLLFRPFLVREEKILLMAKAGEDSTDILSAVKQVVNNCCEEKNFNINKLTLINKGEYSTYITDGKLIIWTTTTAADPPVCPLRGRLQPGQDCNNSWR